MSRSLPNLFSSGDSPERDYTLFLIRLAIASRHERIVEACRQIRRFGGVAHTQFTYHFEIGAFDEQGRFDDAWQSLRRWEQAARGQRIQLALHEWIPRELALLVFYYAPLAFLTGRRPLSARLMETALEIASTKRGWSFQQIHRIYLPEPARRCAAVTLAHIYAALERDLNSWRQWPAFVADAHPKMLRQAGVTRADLLADPTRIDALYRAIMAERDKQRRREDAQRREAILRIAESPRMTDLQQSIERLFPELRDLPKPPTLRELLDAKS